MESAIRTEADLLALSGRQDERQQGQHGDESARNDEVEAVVESSTSDVNGERDVDVRLLATVVELDAVVGRDVCMHSRVIHAKPFQRSAAAAVTEPIQPPLGHK